METALYPVVPGGVKTLSALARELKATERAVAERVRYQLRGSYSHYYRRMLAPLLAALEFRCNNSAYRPVMDAIDLLARYAGTDSDQKVYAAGEKVPVDGVVPKAWLDGVTDDDGRVERIPYELCVLIALRDALRRREVYVQGAGRWKNPDEDLPVDFEDNRDVHYAELGSPWTPPSSSPACGSGWMTGSPGLTPPWPGAPAAGCGSSPGRAARG